MSITPVDVCNIALLSLGESPISSFDEGTLAAKMCKANFVMAMRMVLQAFPWNCATARARMARLTATPAFGFSYAYQLPSDCLFIQSVSIDDVWRREGDRLLTDTESGVDIIYTADLTISSDGRTKITGGSRLGIDSLCANAVAYRLGYMIGEKLTGSGTRAQAMFELYKDALIEAKGVDAMQGTPSVLDGSSWVDVE